jgi:hypothetical protein
MSWGFFCGRRTACRSPVDCEIEKETHMQAVGTKKKLSAEQREELLKTLKARFEKNMNRHKDVEWPKV